MNLKTKGRYLRKLLCIAMAFACVFSCIMPYSPVVSAEESLEDLRNQYEQLEQEIYENEQALNRVEGEIKTNEQKLDKLNDEIDIIEKQMDVLDERINVLNGSIEDLQVSIDSAESDIVTINDQISVIQIQIADAEALMSETKIMLLSRLRENYMSGEASTLELLFSSTDLVTFFTRKELVTRVSENDAALINDLSEKVTQLAALEKELGEKKVELEEKKVVLDTEMNTLSERQSDLQSSQDEQSAKRDSVMDKYEEVKDIVDELDKDSEAYKKALKLQQAERDALDAQIDEYIKKHGSTEGDIPDEEYENDGEMMWPVKGKTTVTAGYPAYSNGSSHWGIDICIVGATGGTRDENGNSYSLGKPFYAAQGGEVIIAHNDGNWNSGFGNYCVIDHGDGKQTLYAHAKRLTVKKGDIVKKGEQIGEIGETGNTTGPHLHFEVRIKKADGSVSRVQPLNYVSKP